MNRPDTVVKQGSSIYIEPEEFECLTAVMKESGMESGCLDLEQGIFNLPQKYVGYINLPTRTISIDSKHSGLSLNHILRVYYFVYSSLNTDLDDPIYDVDDNISMDIVEQFIKELELVVKKGLPVEYINEHTELPYLKGNIDLARTVLRLKLKSREPFDCSFDSLSKDNPINQLLYAALRKVIKLDKYEMYGIFKRYFADVSEIDYVPEVNLNNNNSYCKKALMLARMLMDDVSISSNGDKAYGPSVLIDFDKLFELFIQKVLIEYSDDPNFATWSEKKTYAECHCVVDGDYLKKYQPDLLYSFDDSLYPYVAECVLDMKNKTGRPFGSGDVYETLFYANQLSSHKVILCYPSMGEQSTGVLEFENENISPRRMYAVYMNLAGDSSLEFKDNITTFIGRVLDLV